MGLELNCQLIRRRVRHMLELLSAVLVESLEPSDEVRAHLAATRCLLLCGLRKLVTAVIDRAATALDEPRRPGDVDCRAPDGEPREADEEGRKDRNPRRCCPGRTKNETNESEEKERNALESKREEQPSRSANQ